MINKDLTKQRKSFLREYGALTFWTVMFFVLLLLRDAYSVSVNKYIFLALTGAAMVTLSTAQVIGLYCFLFPLYVGLPGNYMTMMLIVRLLADAKHLRIKTTSFLLTICICGFMLVQNIATGYTSIVPMVYIAGIVLILLLFSYKGTMDTKMLIVMFSAGVAALGYIMLTATLQVYELSDLLNSSLRLGAEYTDYVSSEIMNVSIDPNFYGLFVITAVSTAMPFALNKQNGLKLRLLLLAFSIVSLLICLVGLSRAAVLILAAWAVLYILFQRGLKLTWLILGIVLFVVAVMPDVLDAIFDRFAEDNVSDGNGRIRLIIKFFDEWLADPIVMLFGVGLFNCNVHCTPLQFLFGGGVMLFALVLFLMLSYMPKFTGKIFGKNSLPFWVTFAMMLTIPAACLVNCLFPLVYIGLMSSTKEGGK